MSAIVEARGIYKEFAGRRILGKIQLSPAAGDCFGIGGAEGVGKTTLLRILAAMIRPTEGDVFVFGMNTRSNGAAIRAKLGFVPANDGHESRLTAFENLLLFTRLHGLPARDGDLRIRHLLREMFIEDAADTPVADLSMEQARRLSLARAMLTDPQLIIFDEPTHGLSRAAREWIWTWIERQKSKGRTIIIGSRDLDELERLCGQLVILERGEVACEGEPNNLIRLHVGREVIEYAVGAEELDYHLQALGGKYQYQVISDRLRIYLPEAVDISTALRWVPSEKVVVRRARLEDVYSKVIGRDLGAL